MALHTRAHIHRQPTKGSKWAVVTIETVESHNIHSREPSEKNQKKQFYFFRCVCMCFNVKTYTYTHTGRVNACVHVRVCVCLCECECAVDPPLWSQRAALIPENPISRLGLVMLVYYGVCPCVYVCWFVVGTESLRLGSQGITGPLLIQVGIISNKMWNSFNTPPIWRYECETCDVSTHFFSQDRFTRWTSPTAEPSYKRTLMSMF